MDINVILKRLEEEEIRFVDMRFTDTNGKEHHFTYPANSIDEDFFEEGKMFDGSSIIGWKGIHNSDMILMPDPQTAYIDPFSDHKTLIITCNIIEPDTLQAIVATPAHSPNALKPTSSQQELRIALFLGQKMNTSFLTA